MPGTIRTPWTWRSTAARMVGINQASFYNRYLLSGRLPYVVKKWRHGKDRPRRKSFVLRSALMEVLTRELCQEARRQYVRRSRRSMADLERELDEWRKAGAPLLRPVRE
jgi:hypothetical protein